MSATVLFDYWRSSASYRIRIALNLAGIAYDTVSVDLGTGAQREPDHLARNPQGLVPVLDIDGLRFTQSLAILDYLNDTRAMGLLPSDTGASARARALAYAIAVDLHPVCNLRVAQHVAGLMPDRPDMIPNWMTHFIADGLAAFDAMLPPEKQDPFCCGDTPGFVDICLMPQLYNAHRWNVDISIHPRLQKIEENCSAIPAFAAAHPDRVRP